MQLQSLTLLACGASLDQKLRCNTLSHFLVTASRTPACGILLEQLSLPVVWSVLHKAWRGTMLRAVKVGPIVSRRHAGIKYEILLQGYIQMARALALEPIQPGKGWVRQVILFT